MGIGVLILTMSIWLLPATVTAGVIRQDEEFQSQEEFPCQTYETLGMVYVDCSNRGLTGLPEGITTDVQILDLSNNNIASFPRQLKNFARIETLDLSGNLLNKPLPNFLENWSFLNKLNLSNNNYENWLGNGFNTNVKYLDLSKNKIKHIEETAIIEMPNLLSLDLSENRIENLPPGTFSKINKLERLILNRNYFSDVPRFQSATLTVLGMSNCQITNLNADSFLGMSSLLVVDLSINQIESVPDNLASDTLQELDLSYNEIRTLTDWSFLSLPYLEVLNLRGNEFREVWPASVFTSNLYLRKVHVKGNRWSCEGFNVNLLLTFEYLTKNPSRSDQGSLICYSPGNVTQMTWQQAYIETWHSAETTEHYLVAAVMVGVIIGVLITSLICRGLMALNKPAPPAQSRLNLNGTPVQPPVETVVLRVPLHDEDLPPTYDEALLMPRLNSSFHSLPDFVDEEEVDTQRHYRRSRSIGDLTETRPRIGDRRSVRRVDIYID